MAVLWLQVYGETSFDLVTEVIKHTEMQESDIFLDLGSGERECVCVCVCVCVCNHTWVHALQMNFVATAGMLNSSPGSGRLPLELLPSISLQPLY